MAIRRANLPALNTLMDESWGDANVDLRADLEHVFNFFCQRLSGAHPVSSVLQLGFLEPHVVLSVAQHLRFLFGGVEAPTVGDQPQQDPGPGGDNNGAPWRGCTGLERGMIYCCSMTLARDWG